eukprot:CAMPEP_0184666790 /NCGR_PEP_ID=MMETSP0308-20130426/63803_1 /TAXON_ID=38269 /ORGANISM="Gloeochaete witrockiana, Strain SAG 46.84" /LENGTH=55 /DNA_ID=CAMNT_0027111573 /DNA_START=17 /DNA_END=180 /DNA_ORIENTATION=+
MTSSQELKDEGTSFRRDDRGLTSRITSGQEQEAEEEGGLFYKRESRGVKADEDEP